MEPKLSTDAYTADGVNVELGDDLSKYAGSLCSATFKNNPHIKVHDFSKGHFRGPRAYEVVGLPEGTFFDLGSDGIGTKVVVTDAAFAHRHSNRDWVAMCVDDFARWGGKVLLLNNDLNLSSLGGSGSPATHAAAELLRGLKETADKYGYVMWKGESAELGPCVGSENEKACLKYVWSGTAFGCYHEKNLITGEGLLPGHVVVALREYGFRSNGISSVRAAFRKKFGEYWFKSEEAKPLIEQAAIPSVVYGSFLAKVNGWSDPNLKPIIKMPLLVHLSGGSFKGKFYEDILFRYGFSAELDSLWDPPEIVQRVGEWRGLSSREFYQTLSGGQGMLAVMDRADVSQFIRLAQEDGIEAKECGVILPAQDRPQLIIHSKFNPGEKVVYSA